MSSLIILMEVVQAKTRYATNKKKKEKKSVQQSALLSN